MALPFSRTETATAASKVKSNLVNEMEDAIVARHNKPLHFPGDAFQVQQTANIIFDYTGAWRSVGASGLKTASMPLSQWLIPGDTLKEITWRWKNGATPTAGAITFSITRAPVATPLTPTSIVVVPGQTTNTGAANALRTLLSALNHVVLADNFYALTVEMDATAGNDQAGFNGVSLILGV